MSYVNIQDITKSFFDLSVVFRPQSYDIIRKIHNLLGSKICKTLKKPTFFRLQKRSSGDVL